MFFSTGPTVASITRKNSFLVGTTNHSTSFMKPFLTFEAHLPIITKMRIILTICEPASCALLMVFTNSKDFCRLTFLGACLFIKPVAKNRRSGCQVFSYVIVQNRSTNTDSLYLMTRFTLNDPSVCDHCFHFPVPPR